MSENSSLLSAEDAVSERVRFDDNVSFIDEEVSISSASANINAAIVETAKLHKVRVAASAANPLDIHPTLFPSFLAVAAVGGRHFLRDGGCGDDGDGRGA